MVSVYMNDKFAWQLPKRLLAHRVPTILQDICATNKDSVASDSPTRWEITELSEDAFRLFTEWLYSPRGHLKEPTAGASSKPYFDLNKFACRYKIEDLIAIVKKVVQGFFDSATNFASVGESYEALAPKTPERSSISGHFAALILTKAMEINAFKLLINSTELTRDILIWVALCVQHGKERDSHDEIVEWMGDNYQKWLDVQE